jgi:glutamate carboxypeptidase
MADLLRRRLFAALPGELRLLDPAPVDAMRGDGSLKPLDHGRNLHLEGAARMRRCSCSSPATWTPSTRRSPVPDACLARGRVLGGPGVADMKGGIAVMLAALKAVEASPLARSSAMRS